jgi:tetratricopeptide (TPR) repeat protein
MRSHYGRYAVVRRLGMGAFGEVFLARDPDLARDVAVKVVHGDRIGRTSLELLLREARAVAAVQHPGLVTVYDVGTEEDTAWVVMEYVPGETLRHRMDRDRLPLTEVVRLGGVLCGALAMAHASGVIHRDIKPANILLTPQGDPKLADFGMARSSGDRTITEAGSMVGTLMYMSPQQAMGENVDGRADLFSLAVVLYEMLTGIHPFLRAGEAATLYAILHEPPLPPGPEGPELDPRTQAFFRRALSKEVSERHPDAIAFVEDLAFLLDPPEAGSVPIGAASRPPEKGARFESRLVGRDVEYRRLCARLERVRAGEGGAVLLSGEAGIGKTRLLTELSRAAEEQNIRVVRGRSLFEGGPAYHPWHQVLAQAFNGTPRGATEGFESFLASHPEFSGARAASLRRLLHLGPGDSPDLSGPDQLWEAAVAALQTLASHRPLLVVLDDLHWADPSSLQLFRFAATHARGQKWLLIGAFRPEEAEAEAVQASVGEVTRLMGREEGVESVQLSRLDQAATAAMVDELLEEHIAGTPLEQRIYAETEGNPLFIVEVAKLASSTGGRLEDLAIPRRVVDVVEHRLDRLTEPERDGLEVAAVEGEYFHVAPIATVLELTRLKALKLLQGLERRHRIVRPAEQRFRFDHGKIREVILGRIAPSLRREYHGVVAQCLVEESAGVASSILAHHLTESGDAVAALPYRRKAGEEARAVFANEEALHHFGQALATLETQPADAAVETQRAEIRIEMAEVHFLTGDFTTAASLFQRVATGAVPSGAEWAPARALLGEAECEFALARYDRAEQKLDEARHAAESTDDQPLLSLIHVMIARVHTRRGAFEAALASCARSEALARALGDDRHRVLTMLESGDVCVRRGAFDQAREFLESALGIAEHNADLGGQARALRALATVARERGDFPGALGYLERSGAIARRMGDAHGEARALANQGNVHLHRGEWEQARRCYEPALRSFRALGERHSEAIVLGNMSVSLSASGDYEGAMRLGEECLALHSELGDRLEVTGALDNLGILQHRRGRSTEARAWWTACCRWRWSTTRSATARPPRRARAKPWRPPPRDRRRPWWRAHCWLCAARSRASPPCARRRPVCSRRRAWRGSAATRSWKPCGRCRPASCSPGSGTGRLWRRSPGSWSPGRHRCTCCTRRPGHAGAWRARRWGRGAATKGWPKLAWGCG